MSPRVLLGMITARLKRLELVSFIGPPAHHTGTSSCEIIDAYGNVFTVTVALKTPALER